MLSVLRSLFGRDVTISNVEDRLDCLIARLNEIVYDEKDRDFYPPRYLELALRLRLHLFVLKFETIPSFGDRLFLEEIETIEANHIQRLFNNWDQFFSAKEVSPPATREAGNNSVFVEINLDAVDADVVAEIKKIMEEARRERYWQPLFRKDSSGRYIRFPFKEALSALETYEDMMKTRSKTPTESAKATYRPRSEDNFDSYKRAATRQVHEKLDTYLFWGELD